jgi:hypothetical protein
VTEDQAFEARIFDDPLKLSCGSCVKEVIHPGIK